MGDFERSVIDALPAAFIVADREGHYLAFNKAAERLLGGRPRAGDVPGSPRYVEVFHSDGATPMTRDEIPLIRALAGEELHDATLVVKNEAHPDGRHITSSAGPIRDEHGEIVAGVTVMHDITARIDTERRLQQTQRMLERSQKMEAIGRLAGSVAHDFNNILTVIESYAHLVERALAADDPTRADVGEIRRASERAAGLTRQLLAMSRQSPVPPRLVDLNDVITGFEPMLRRLLGNSVELDLRHGRIASTLADPGQIEQVLMNLAVNARDAMPAGGRLAIETSSVALDADAAALRGLAAGPYVVVAVTDTGVGMDEETQRRIFEPFFTTKEVGKGTGLGLAIVHGIVAQAGGTVAMYSEPGHGTTFRVYLPVAEGAARPAIETPLPAPDRLPPATILVVEDDHQVRTVTAKILQAAGCTVLEAASAEEARHLFVSQDAIDVVLTDVVLADGRGDALAAQLFDLRPDARIVLMSGFPAGALANGAERPLHLLGKPFGPADVRSAIATALADRPTRAAIEPSASPVRARPSVLLVDDDDGLRRAIARWLDGSGFDVHQASGGRAGIEALRERRFDVIVSDVQMPEGGGVELLRSIRGVDLDVPVVLVTGNPDVASAAKAIEYGAFRYLIKPLDPRALEKVLRHAARSHALARLRREAFSASGSHARGAVDRAGLEVRLDAALDNLWMAFQPIVDARSGALYGVEALLRSDEPSMPGPDSLLEAATLLRRLPQLGRRVRASSAAAFAPHRERLTLFVNLHPEDLDDLDLASIEAPLSRLAKHVVLEVTERASLRGSPGLSSRLARLREMGFRLAVDDIGAGYSGLTSFAELMPEVVKIDMSLVRDVHLSAVKQRTIRSLCALCHEMGTIVVGEGVETPAERDCLVEVGCDLLQGYFFARPARELPS